MWLRCVGEEKIVVKAFLKYIYVSSSTYICGTFMCNHVMFMNIMDLMDGMGWHGIDYTLWPWVWLMYYSGWLG